MLSATIALRASKWIWAWHQCCAEPGKRQMTRLATDLALSALLQFRCSSRFHSYKKKLRTPLPRGSSLCESMGEGCCTQPYPCICKEAVSGFEPMTNKSPKHLPIHCFPKVQLLTNWNFNFLCIDNLNFANLSSLCRRVVMLVGTKAIYSYPHLKIIFSQLSNLV